MWVFVCMYACIHVSKRQTVIFNISKSTDGGYKIWNAFYIFSFCKLEVYKHLYG